MAYRFPNPFNARGPCRGRFVMRKRTSFAPVRLSLLLLAFAVPAVASEPPTEVRQREASELIRGDWIGQTVNQDQRVRDARLSLPGGDFTEATGRFNNWKVLKGQAKSGRRGSVVVLLFAPGREAGRDVEKPITCVGKFDEGFRRWTGRFEGFNQSGHFELTRQVEPPEAELLRGRWEGQLTTTPRRGEPESFPLTMNLLTGEIDQATAVTYHSDAHPAAETITLHYHHAPTRQLDVEIAFADPEDRRARTDRSLLLQGVFDEQFTRWEGAYEATGRAAGAGRFVLKKQPP
jgi:hypothetical protein